MTHCALLQQFDDRVKPPEVRAISFDSDVERVAAAPS